MNLNSLQVCMDGPDWQQICHVMAPDEQRTDSSSPSEEMITCPRPMIERRLRPQQDQALKCPRCDSTHTKFCYYNNYSLSQPRYFCKTCRRYWTKGGSLRNVPVGGGCRKNKKVAAAKKPIDPPSNPHLNLSYDETNLHLSFPGLQLAHLNNLYGNSADLTLKSKYDSMPGDPRDANFMENKLNVMLGNSREYTFLENNDPSHLGGGLGGVSHGFASSSLHGLCSPFGFSMDGSQGTYMEVGEKTLLPFGGSEDPNSIDIKPPNNKYLSLERQEEGCSEIGKDPFGHLMSGLGSWSGVMNG